MKDSNLKEVFEQFLFDYLDTYFGKRDLPKTLEFFDSKLTGFGTGIDEIGLSEDDFKSLFKRDIEAAPTPFEYSYSHLKTTIVNETTAVVMCTLDIKGSIDGYPFNLNHLRQSLVLARTEVGVKLIHKHISFPTIEHEEGEPYPLKEIEDLTKVVDTKVQEKTMTLLEAYQKLEKIVIYDKLTGLLNRNRITDLIHQEIHRANRYKSTFSLIFFDIDDFKKVNDTYGHPIGDRVITEIGEVVQKNIRDTDFAARWGGDEFIILLPEASHNAVLKLAKKLHKIITKNQFINDVKISISSGITNFTSGDDFSRLYERVDQALYQAKDNNKNCIIFK